MKLHSDYYTLWQYRRDLGPVHGMFFTFGEIHSPYFQKWIIVGHELRQSLSRAGVDAIFLSVPPPAVEARGSQINSFRTKVLTFVTNWKKLGKPDPMSV